MEIWILTMNKNSSSATSATNEKEWIEFMSITHQNATKVQKHPLRTKLPIRKSSRLIQSHDQIVISTKIPTTSTCIEKSIHPDTERPRQWSQIYNLPTKICCSDISREALTRVWLNLCYRCDNFWSNWPFMAPGTKQENAYSQWYN